ncbi:MAG: hypothetical protein K9N35_04105 [Candidatus Marinimicrobia bacterium]|nr:hypothetical protein [Candidatus Neomarinimicrobiota bacterium]
MLQILNRENQSRTFWVLFAFTIVVIIGMQLTGGPLKTDAAPGGIVTFEIIGTLEGSLDIINSWQGQSMTWAGINMGLDFLFIVLYSLTLAMACRLIADKFVHPLIKQSGIWLARAVFLAAMLDVIENIALIKLLTGSQSEFLPILARWCALPKFFLIILALIYVILGIYPAMIRPTKN